MEIKTEVISFQTEGYTSIINLSDEVSRIIRESELQEGQATVYGIGATTGITTLEYEPGLVNKDVDQMLGKLAPYGHGYAHNQTWGDDNGASHLRSALIGTSQAFPFKDKRLLTGTWQQIVFLDFDTRARKREVVVQLIGK